MTMFGISIMVFLIVWCIKNLGLDDGDSARNLAKQPLKTIYMMQILSRVGAVTIIMGMLWNTYSHH